MIILNTDNSSPFLVLWYMYLVFLGAVILINLLAFIAGKLFSWRTRRLERKYASNRGKA